MNRVQMMLAARQAPQRKHPFWLKGTEIPTPETILRDAIKAWQSLDDLQFRHLSKEDLSSLLELFVMGRDLSVQLARQGYDEAIGFIPLFNDAGEAMATIAERKVRRATASELKTLKEAAKVLDGLLSQSPPAMVLRAQAAAASMVTRVYNHRKPTCKKRTSKRSRKRN